MLDLSVLRCAPNANVAEEFEPRFSAGAHPFRDVGGVRFGSITEVANHNSDVRYAPQSASHSFDAGCPLSARKRKSQDAGGTSVMCQQRTWMQGARPSSVDCFSMSGFRSRITIPSAFIARSTTTRRHLRPSSRCGLAR